MGNLIQENKVLYVEPNCIDGVTAFSDGISTGNKAYKIPDEENFCIVVMLSVEVKGRSYCGSKEGNTTNVTMEWQSQTNGQTVNFMQGSKIYTDKNRTKYINSLTTNYTDIFLDDIKDSGTAEMFGINSIDISYNSFMVPEVTIEFVDVRGVSLFAQEEYRHNVVKNGITATANNDIEGSFFKSFFTFPYPKFVLKVKGFYGKMVSYELTCSDYRAAFDSKTGSFNVTAKFIGYAFSFLNDVMVNGIVAAPYSSYAGEEYWNDNLATRFLVTDKNGSQIPMVKLGELCKSMNDIVKNVQDKLQESGGLQELAQQQGLDAEQMAVVNGATAEELEGKIDSVFNGSGAVMTDIRHILSDDGDIESEGDCCIPDPSQYSSTNSWSFCFVSNDERVTYNEKAKHDLAVRGIMSKINQYSFPELDKWKQEGHDLKITHIKNANDFITDAGKLKGDYVTDESLKNAIESYIESKEKQTNNSNYADSKWKNWKNSHIYIFQDFGLKKVIKNMEKSLGDGSSGSDSDSTVNNNQSSEQVFQTVANNAVIQSFIDNFNFPPTVENITRTIMAHFETYIHMISTCADTILQQGTARSVESLGITLENFPDSKPNGSTASDETIVVPPFPIATTTVTDDGVDKVEETWIGDFGDENSFEEIKLIEGILYGVEQAAKDINYESPSTTDADSGESLVCPMPAPLTYFDLFMKDGDNMFGEVDTTSVEDIFAHFAIRSVLMETTITTLDFHALGKCDAENFCAQYNTLTKPLDNLKNSLKTDSLSADKIYQYVRGNIKKLSSGGQETSPWPDSNELFFVNGGRSICTLGGICPSSTKQCGHAIPIKNWTWDGFGKAFKNNKVVQSDLSSYTSDYTPLVNKSRHTYLDDKSINLVYLPASYSHFKNSYEKLKSSTYGSDIATNLFTHIIFLNRKSDAKITFDSSLWYDAICEYTKIGDHVNCSLEYDENGSLQNGNTVVFDTIPQYANYSDKKYYKTDDIYTRAYDFLDGIYGRRDTTDKRLNLNTDLYSILYYNLSISANDIYPFVYTAPQIDILYQSARMYKEGYSSNYYKEYRTTVFNKFVDYFKNWVNKNFKKLCGPFVIKFKNGVDATTVFGNGDTTFTESNFENIYNNYIDKSTFDLVYKKNGKYFETIKGTQALKELQDELFKIVSVCVCSPYIHINVADDDRTTVKGNNFNYLTTSYDEFCGYMGGVLDGLREILDVQESDNSESTSSDTESSSVTINGDSDDIRVGIYSYIKMLYDKWLASGYSLEDYTMEKMFDDDDHTFHFIDSFYNKIGKSIYMNLSRLVDLVHACQVQNGFTLLSMLSDVYAANKLQILCVQNFLDLSKKENLERVFTPIPYLEVEPPDNHPDFVVMYPYEPSSKLDVEGASFPDDTFYLNDATTWPAMISSKQSTDMAIPAFGVSYGQQYQNFFKTVQVDMNAPTTTEQSLKAKFMICGANQGEDSDGPRVVTVGQDLYTIYSNNSYDCTVTMMGCAWIQPLMYFVLNNVPMFRGSYLIKKVTHQITPGNMITTFTGCRMANKATRAVKNYLFGADMDSNGENAEEIFAHENAAPGNDCAWSYVNPVGGIANIDGIKLMNAHYKESNPNNEQKKNMRELLPIIKSEGAKLKNGAPWNVIAAMCEHESMWTDSVIYKGKTPGTSTAKGIGQFLIGTAQQDAYKDYLVNIKRGNYVVDDRNDPKKLIPCMVISLNTLTDLAISKNSALKNRPKDCVFAAIAHYAAGNAPMNSMCDLLKTSTVDSLYAKDAFPSKVKNYLTWMYKNYDKYAASSSNSSNSQQSDAEMHSGFTQAVQASLNTSSAYANATVKMTEESGGYLKLSCGDGTKNNALFDCLLQTYKDWFDIIYWVSNTGKMSGDCSGVRLHYVKKPPTTVTAGMYGSNSAVNLSGKGDLNDSLKKSIIKFFRAKGITTVDKAKSAFTAIANLSDSDIKSLFELESDAGAVTKCSSLTGYPSGGGAITGFSGEVNNPLMKKVLSNVGTFESGTFGKSSAPIKKKAKNGEWILYKDNYGGKCTSGPRTWYGRAGKFRMESWWGGASPATYKATTIGIYGFIPVWHGTLAQIDALTSKELRPGDVATLYQGKADRKSQHGMMWTGHDWRSDCIQHHADCEHQSDQGSYAAVIWRHPDFQEEGMTVEKMK